MVCCQKQSHFCKNEFVNNSSLTRHVLAICLDKGCIVYGGWMYWMWDCNYWLDNSLDAIWIAELALSVRWVWTLTKWKLSRRWITRFLFRKERNSCVADFFSKTMWRWLKIRLLFWVCTSFTNIDIMYQYRLMQVLCPWFFFGQAAVSMSKDLPYSRVWLHQVHKHVIDNQHFLEGGWHY